METVRRKIINKKQFSLKKLSSTTNGMDARDNFYTDQSFVDWYKTTQVEGHSSFFKKDRFMDLMIINFENTASHKYLLQKSKSLWMDRSEMT